MIGSFLTKGLVMVFGYAYPSYECYKHVEMNKPEIEQLRFWCQYWILVAILTICERIGDPFVSWVPMYSEAKLAFFIYLWYPKAKVTTYVYDSFFRPYVAKHETEIDRNLLELRTRAGDIAVLYWQRAWGYGQTRIFSILQYVAAQSTAQPRPVQPAQARQQVASARQPQVPNRQPTTTTPMEESGPSSTSLVKPQKEVAEESGPPQVTRPAPRRSNSEKVVAAPEIMSQSTETVVSKGAESLPHPVDENMNLPEKETVMEEPKEPTRTTRGRLRKARSAETGKE